MRQTDPTIQLSLCNLCVLCASVVAFLRKHLPQRHREHRGCTEDFKLGQHADMDSLFPPGLADPKVYQQNMAAFQTVLGYPVTDPRFMPVTRDMSRDKRNALLAWLAARAPGPAT